MTDTINWSPQAELVASFSSKADGRDRWTELELFFDPGVDGKKVWRAVSKGCSSRRGEVTKNRELAAGTVDRAMKLFDPDTDAGRIMQAQVDDWMDANSDRAGRVLMKGVEPPVLCMDDQAALRQLFGTDTTLKSQAEALGLGESTLRMQLKDGKDVRVALRAILPFVDIAAFRRARGIGA